MIDPIEIGDVRPRAPGGEFPAKAVAARSVRVSADIFKDGHSVLAAQVLWRPMNGQWTAVRMAAGANYRWWADFQPEVIGPHEYKVQAWTDHFMTWQRDVAIKHEAGQDISVELEEGAALIELSALEMEPSKRPRYREVVATLRDESLGFAERLAATGKSFVTELFADSPLRHDLSSSRPMPVWVDRERALYSSWYELFPRSLGGFMGTVEHLPRVAGMGFDVLYLPPIHPIGATARKGRNNAVTHEPDDVGSPWAIGSKLGGHTAIHPDLGTIDDFHALVDQAAEHGLEIALDYALQCSVDHPWVAEHPEWFHHRPDGSIKFAENPPKKYQDIVPINFWPSTDRSRSELWDACKQILDYWIAHGVKIFRVDNPHTKPLAFWAWLIPAVQIKHPEVIFLAEAFTHPKMMAQLAEIGFTQSYTYFTWRTHKQELTDYLNELAYGPTADYMRPNFWPNTPDILSGPLRGGGPGVFKQRLVLAATMAPSYGIYSGYELMENEPARPTDEEYLFSEKYEIKHRDFDLPGNLVGFVTRINELRRQHRALRQLRNIRFHHADNSQLIVYSKATHDLSDVVLVVVNLDPGGVQEGLIELDAAALGVDPTRPYTATDGLTWTEYTWTGNTPFVRLDGADQPAHILHITQIT
ncbi:MAG: alpha-1,4-glucan--maltose-1-phosphate maltosyltransferase [Actinomycetota bacterium]